MSDIVMRSNIQMNQYVKFKTVNMNLIWIIFIGVAIISYFIQYMLNKRFDEYSNIQLMNGMTGKDVAEKMLRDNGITDVKVGNVPGKLTDHYNPTDKTLNLSDAVYNSSSVAAAAVAAHECGHALQHASEYSFLKLRSMLVPAVSFASKWVQWVLLGGILLVEIFPQLLLFGICLFATTTLFSIVTLPVEVNASTRAMSWLSSAGIVNSATYPKAASALKWAASTYFISAISSLATLVYYIMIYLSRRD